MLFLDQLTKSCIRAFLPLGSSFPDWEFVRLTHTINIGAVFGLFPYPTLIIAFTILVVFLSLIFYRRLEGIRVPFGMIVGGGMGNLIDRLRQGYVTDFIDLRVWPVFNLADTFIVIGVGLVILHLIRKGDFK